MPFQITLTHPSAHHFITFIMVTASWLASSNMIRTTVSREHTLVSARILIRSTWVTHGNLVLILMWNTLAKCFSQR